MSWVIGVPSWRRADVVGAKTLRTLADGGVPAHRVFLFVAEEEVGDYRRHVDRGLYGAIVAHKFPGSCAGAHNAVVDFLGPGRVAQADDDIDGYYEAIDRATLKRIEDVAGLIDLGFAEATRHRATLWGIYPVFNSFYMRRRVYTRNCLVIGHLFGQFVSGRRCELTTLNVKNDYERSLQHFMHDGCVARLDWVAADTRVYQGRGGLKGIRTPELATEAVEDLRRRFPGLVRRSHRDGAWPEIRLVMPRS